MKQKKVIVALSGGVDSSVSAALLKRDGFDVVGVFMKCWAEGKKCTSTEDEKMARMSAVEIGIPFYSLDLIKEYRERVVEYMVEGYENGITPNPDVMCNKEIKFGLFFEKALNMGADFVATGHYAQIKNGKILAGRDLNKDQSYFLSMIDASVLTKVLFPIGGYTKPQVRALAKKFGLPTAERPDSQGLCFIGNVDFKDFLSDFIPESKGEIVDMEGRVVGSHPGVWFYTIGQRKGIRLSGGPWFVVEKNRKDNTLIVSTNEKDLYKKELQVTNLNWFEKDVSKNITARIRYRQKPAQCKVMKEKDGSLRLVFTTPQRAIAPGQAAVLYNGSEMLGGGIIQ